VRALVSLLTLAFFAPIATGCISNEYVIPRNELQRLVMTPPEIRGQQVHVIQDLGSRRADAVPTDGPDWERQAQPWPQPQDTPPPSEDAWGGNPSVDIYVSGDGRPGPVISGGGGWRGTPQPLGRATASSGSWRGTPTPSGGSITGWKGPKAAVQAIKDTAKSFKKNGK